jgi:hypothetical protein
MTHTTQIHARRREQPRRTHDVARHRERAERRVGRFSDGIERLPRSAASERVGRFSDGIERLPRTAGSMRFGNFADGIATAPANRRLGSFGDTHSPRAA